MFRTLTRCILNERTPKEMNNLKHLDFNKKNNVIFMLTRLKMSGEATAVEENVEIEGMELSDIVNKLTNYAPLTLAESWDNVGLLIEPFSKKKIKRIMLTNDLTVNVMNECLSKNTDLVISYHPPIFSGIKKFSTDQWTASVVACCLENRIAVYSPHTTWDSVPGGISDWLASAFDCESTKPLQPYYSYYPPEHMYSVVVNFFDDNIHLPRALADKGVNKTLLHSNGDIHEFIGSCNRANMPDVYYFLKQLNNISFEVYNRVPLPEKGTGIGRHCKLVKPITMKEAIERIKKHTEVNYARVAYAVGSNQDSLIESAAVVPGSGGKVLQNVKADLYVTGEMLHHDVLAAIHRNASVIMTSHSDSERGFLKKFATELGAQLNGSVKVNISVNDKDPINIIV